ncbi:hypothetical protein CL622_01165 [archaeon]|nr:hypothetical protein [archaeon]|tara:strand:- start:1120 stop:1473 length:354 start_codon:yes stop_codon:yes gene_type:complete
MVTIKAGDKILATNASYAKTFFQRLRGYMFRRIRAGSGLIFVLNKKSILHSSIHMLFVFGKLDVLWLDKQKRVITIRRNMRPFIDRGQSQKPAKYIVELPTGIESKIKENMTLKFEN